MSGGSRELIDTNVLVYAFSTDPRSLRAEEILARGCLVSVQGLNEFANVAKRKLGMDADEVAASLDVVKTLCADVLPIDLDVHEDAMRLALHNGFSIFDALVVASALRAHCVTLWSEDMQHGRVVADRLRIVNPFA